jgi:hypothetical protein
MHFEGQPKGQIGEVAPVATFIWKLRGNPLTKEEKGFEPGR